MPFIATDDLEHPAPPGARRTAWRDLALCALVVCAVALIVDFLVVTSFRGEVRPRAIDTIATVVGAP